MYKHLKNIIPSEYIRALQKITLRTKLSSLKNRGKPKNYGSGGHGKVQDMTSLFNKDLYEIYTSEFAYEIAKKFLPKKIYLFNEQIVVKLPKELFAFVEPHYDNQYSPRPKDHLETYTMAWVLDDWTPENGGVQIFDKGEFIKIPAKIGDIVVWHGDTLHRSLFNQTNKPRRVWLTVYSAEPVGENMKKGFYFKEFKRNKNEN